METSQPIGKKDFRREVTKLKKDLKSLFALSKKFNDNKSKPILDDAGQTVVDRVKLNQMRDEIFNSMDNLPSLFTSRRKKVAGSEKPGENLVGFGKPTLVDKGLIEFFNSNLTNVNGKVFSKSFPALSQHGVGSRIALQSLLNLVIRVSGARIQQEKKREQISVKHMKGMESMINRANQILSARKKELIQIRDTITSSDVLKILNAFVARESDLTDEDRKLLDDTREEVRKENILAKRLLEENKPQTSSKN
jgi:hypothetical protein